MAAYTQILGSHAEGAMGYNHTAAGHSCSSAINSMNEVDWILQRNLACQYCPRRAGCTGSRVGNLASRLAEKRLNTELAVERHTNFANRGHSAASAALLAAANLQLQLINNDVVSLRATQSSTVLKKTILTKTAELTASQALLQGAHDAITQLNAELSREHQTNVTDQGASAASAAILAASAPVVDRRSHAVTG